MQNLTRKGIPACVQFTSLLRKAFWSPSFEAPLEKSSEKLLSRKTFELDGTVGDVVIRE